MVRIFLGLALMAALGAPAWAGGPQVSPNVQVSAPQQLFPADFPGRNSTSIAVGEDEDELVVVWEDLQGLCGPPTNRACPPNVPAGSMTGFGYSVDGGETFVDGGSPAPVAGALTSGHPWVDSDGNGTFYVVSRARDSVTGGTRGLLVHRGSFSDGGFSLDAGTLLAPTNAGDFFSRSAVAADKSDDCSGSAYIVQSNIINLCGVPAFGFGQIEVFATHDGGNTWGAPVVVSPDGALVSDPDDPDCGFEGPLQVAPSAAVGPEGEVYVLWEHGPDFLFDGSTTHTSRLAFSSSFDGGATFTSPLFIRTINSNRENPPVGYERNRFNDRARIAVAQNGKHKGRIYVSYTAPAVEVVAGPTVQSAVSSQAYIVYSDNHGASWSAPIAVGPAVPASGVKRIWPTVSVTNGGKVDVVYVEVQETQLTPDPLDEECNILIGGGLRRRGPLASVVDVYRVRSTNGGASFDAPAKVTEVSSNWCAIVQPFPGNLSSNFGEYIGTAPSGGNRTLATWSDGRNLVPDVFFAEVKGGGH